MKRNYHKLGSFEMTGCQMVVSDPCYEHDLWCCNTIPGCLAGRWDTAVAYQKDDLSGTRVALLAAKHKSVRSFSLCSCIRADEQYIYYTSGWEVCDFGVGVDSGQAGLFDAAHYRDDHVFDGAPEAEHDFGRVWYNHCCDRTLEERQAGVIPFGVVSSSGYGDGCYTAL